MNEWVQGLVYPVVLALAGWGINLNGRVKVIEKRDEDFRQEMRQRLGRIEDKIDAKS